jgi:hypothetical protein
MKGFKFLLDAVWSRARILQKGLVLHSALHKAGELTDRWVVRTSGSDSGIDDLK